MTKSARRLAGQLFRGLVRKLGYGAAHDQLRVRALRAGAGTWMATRLGGSVPRLPEGEWSARVESRARETQQLGAQPLWSRYASLGGTRTEARRNATRTSDEVRTSGQMGRFFTWLVTDRRPSVVVEFGTAFGVSGMYWLSGLEMNARGRLLTFEPNDTWARIAQENLAAIGTRFKLTVGTFEENIDRALSSGERIDVAFIDAIHTSEFVEPQFEFVAMRLAPGGIVLLDDIDFSPDMRACWQRLRDDRRLVATAEVGRVGIVEFDSL